MIMGKDKLIPVIAMILILIGVSAALYVHATQVNKDTITIKGEEYTIDQIFTLAEKKTITTDDGEKTGVSLEDLMKKVGVSCTSCSTYTFKASDAYEQTVDYNTLKTGILTKERRAVFPNTAHKLWVSDVIEIEVK
jgi:hypothetical protein